MKDTLQLYLVDAHELPLDEQERLFKLLDGWSFFTNRVIHQNGKFVVHWEKKLGPIESVIHSPSGCAVSPMR